VPLKAAVRQYPLKELNPYAATAIDPKRLISRTTLATGGRVTTNNIALLEASGYQGNRVIEFAPAEDFNRYRVAGLVNSSFYVMCRGAGWPAA
jgi:hypothetical protein